MIGLDTNILVCYITQDDPVQSRGATEIIERQLSVANPGFVSVVTIAEFVWVLERAYGLTSQDVTAAIERILQVEVLVVEDEQEVFSALVNVKKGLGAFADALITQLGARAGCKHILTFDKKALRLPAFKLA